MMPNLSKVGVKMGMTVLTDRSLFSTLVYHHSGFLMSAVKSNVSL